MIGDNFYFLLALLVLSTYVLPSTARLHSLPSKAGLSRATSQNHRTEYAYATLLYGDEFLLGVRVLGKSIQDTGATKDMVALVSDGVSNAGMQLLEADGWIVKRIELLANPNSKRPARFWGVYTKLKIFNMTEYKKVLYLDADTIVTRSIEDLFACQGFCANLKHSERLNSGVMVIEPSKQLFDDMLSKVQSTYSYTGGDQGFLNSYYPEFPNAELFDPALTADIRKAHPKTMERLSTLYNADVGLFALANKWMVDAKELRVIHYTLGPLKAWDWWTSWLLQPVDMWQDIRVTLKDVVPGTKGGRTLHNTFVVWGLFIIPFLVLGFFKRALLCEIQKDLFALVCSGSFCMYARQLWYKYKPGGTLPSYSTISSAAPNSCKHQGCPKGGATDGLGVSCRVPKYLGITSIAACFGAVLVSLALAVFLVPRQVLPWTGLVLTYEWTIFTFMFLFGKFLNGVYSYGRTVATLSLSIAEELSQYSAAKGHSRNSVSWDAETCTYGLAMAVFALLIPALPFVFGVTAIFARAGLMIAGGFVLIAVVTYASERLAIHWFLRGHDELEPIPSQFPL